MHIVAPAAAIGCRIVSPKNFDRSPFATGAQYARHEMRLGFMHFADQSGGRRTCRIEVSQRNATQTVGSSEVCKHLLDEPLASPVRIHRNTRMRFVDWRVAWLAIERGGRREHDRRRAMSQYRSQQVQCAGDIVLEVEQW